MCTVQTMCKEEIHAETSLTWHFCHFWPQWHKRTFCFFFKKSSLTLLSHVADVLKRTKNSLQEEMKGLNPTPSWELCHVVALTAGQQMTCQRCEEDTGRPFSHNILFHSDIFTDLILMSRNNSSGFKLIWVTPWWFLQLFTEPSLGGYFSSWPRGKSIRIHVTW